MKAIAQRTARLFGHAGFVDLEVRGWLEKRCIWFAGREAGHFIAPNPRCLFTRDIHQNYSVLVGCRRRAAIGICSYNSGQHHRRTDHRKTSTTRCKFTNRYYDLPADPTSAEGAAHHSILMRDGGTIQAPQREIAFSDYVQDPVHTHGLPEPSD